MSQPPSSTAEINPEHILRSTGKNEMGLCSEWQMNHLGKKVGVRWGLVSFPEEQVIGQKEMAFSYTRGGSRGT